MDPQEIRDKIMAAINGIIKDDSETSNSSLHDVLAAKMRARMNPTSEPDEPSEPEEPTIDLDNDPDKPDDAVPPPTNESTDEPPAGE